MAANIHIEIRSPHGGRTFMDLNPDQLALIVDVLDGHRNLRQGNLGPWLVGKLLDHTTPKEPTND